MDAIGILPQYQGRLMRDRLSSYDHYDCEQSICGAHLLRDLTQAGGQWVQNNDRTREMAQGLRVQGEQAVGTVSRQVEQNPMMSLAVAFAMGYLLATMTRR